MFYQCAQETMGLLQQRLVIFNLCRDLGKTLLHNLLYVCSANICSRESEGPRTRFLLTLVSEEINKKN